MIKIRPVTDSDRQWIEETVYGHGSDFVVSKGRKSYPQASPGFVALDAKGGRVGLLSYVMRGKSAEIILIDTMEQGKGIGGSLMKYALRELKKAGIARVWAMTTNNNLDEFNFYQRHGFRLVKVYPDAMEKARRIKPSIPEICVNGLPILDELEFELKF